MRGLFLVAVALGFLGPAWAASVSAQEPTLEDVKAKFGSLSRADIENMGYTIDAECVDGSALPPPVREQLGVTETAAMGFHAVREDLFDTTIDALEPEVIILGPGDEVWGVEYESAEDTPTPEILGQAMNLTPGHPGMEFSHYVLHAWFVDNPAGQFADFNPSLSCPQPAPSIAAPNAPSAGGGGFLDQGGAGVPTAAWVALVGAILLLAGGSLAWRSRRT